MTALTYISLSVLLFSYISSLNTFRLDFPTPFKHFSSYLLFTFTIELIAAFWYKIVAWMQLPYTGENTWIYNIYTIPAYLFYLYFFYRQQSSKNIRLAIKITAPVYLLFCLVNYFFITGPLRFNKHSVLAGGIIVILLSLTYFYQILFSPKLIRLKNEPMFWISSGAFIFHLGTVIGISFLTYLYHNARPLADTLMVFIKYSGTFMYLTYSIAFLCRQTTPYSSK